MSPKNNKRRNVRVVCNASARAEGAKGPVRGICRNISVGGLFFLGPVFPVGQLVELTVDLPGGKVQAQGEVRYHATYPEGTGVGLRFTRLSQEHLALVAKFVETNPPA